MSATATVVITRRSRNLGFGWTTHVEQTPTGLRVCEPAIMVKGGIKACLAELEDSRRYTSGGTCWRQQLWVGGRRVVDMKLMDVANELEFSGTCTVTVEA